MVVTNGCPLCQKHKIKGEKVSKNPSFLLQRIYSVLGRLGNLICSDLIFELLVLCQYGS